MNKQNAQGRVSRRALVVGTAAAAIARGVRLAAAGEITASQPATTAAPLRVAQIGIQGHYFHVIDGIPKLRDCQLVGVARSMPDEKIEDLKKKPAWTEQTRLYEDYRKMLDELKPDIVAVFAPLANLGEASIEAVRHRCHVISEKPLALRLEELRTLLREQDHAGVRISAILPYRLFPAFVAARKAIVEEGLIGEPVQVCVQKSYRWGGPESRPEYYKYRKTYGGTIPWIGTHGIDYIRYVTGLEYANVTARHAVKVNKDYPECEDCAALLFEMTNGGQTVLTLSYLRPAKAPSHGDDRLQVTSSKGCLELRHNNKSSCELIMNDGPPRQLPLPRTESNVFIDFVRSLRGEKPHVLSAEDAFRATEVALKARDAADLRQTVAL